MRVGYILNEFPSDTEYFILYEMVELNKNGIIPVILRLNYQEQAANPQHPAWKNRFEIVDIGQWISPMRWLRYFLFVLRSPLNVLNAIDHVLRSAHSPKMFLTGCRNLLQAIDLADQTSGLNHLHAHFANSPTEVGILISLLKKVPFSFSAHARDLFVEGRNLERKILHSRFVVTCTEYNQRFIRQKVSVSCHPGIQTIYHGIDPGKWEMRQREPSNNDFVILTVGRLVEKKGIRVALEALKRLDTQGRQVRYIIVGDGPERASLQQISREIWNVHVVFTGVLPQHEVRKYLHMAHVMLHPAIVAQDGDRDGIPNVLLEAMASGVPVIASDVSAIPELVEHMKTGILVPPADTDTIIHAITTLMKDSEMRRSLASRARQHIERHFNIETATHQLVKLFSSASP